MIRADTSSALLEPISKAIQVAFAALSVVSNAIDVPDFPPAFEKRGFRGFEIVGS